MNSDNNIIPRICRKALLACVEVVTVFFALYMCSGVDLDLSSTFVY